MATSARIDPLELSRQLVVEALRRNCSTAEIGELSTFVLQAELVVEDAYRLRAAQLMKQTLGFYSVGQGQLVAPDGRRYISAVSEYGASRNECRLEVFSLSIEKDTTRSSVTRRGALKSPGRFTSARVVVPTEMQNIATTLLEHAQATFDTGYAWIADKIYAAAKSAETRIADGLYALAREFIPEKEIRRELWFASLGPVYGFRLSDREAIGDAMDTYVGHAKNIAMSPLDMLAQLLQSHLPRKLLLMDAAASEYTTVNVDISDAGYAKEHMPYTFVMQGLYSGTSFTIFPIVHKESLAVLALYPTGRPVIESRLELHRSELVDRANNLISAVVEAEDLFEPAQTTEDDEQSLPSNVGLALPQLVAQIREADAKQQYFSQRKFKRRKRQE